MSLLLKILIILSLLLLNFIIWAGILCAYLPDNFSKEITIEKSPDIIFNMVATAYTSRLEETDSTPCTSASNMDICKTTKLIGANNCLPFGTKLRDIKTGRVIEIQDRMKWDKGCDRLDLHFKDLSDAREFGVREMQFVLLK
jgi:3D (Asp-Asp-Asp) domain-containing protein